MSPRKSWAPSPSRCGDPDGRRVTAPPCAICSSRAAHVLELRPRTPWPTSLRGWHARCYGGPANEAQRHPMNQPRRSTPPPSAPRWLRAIADVRPGEAQCALALALVVFLLLTAYYLLKVAREPLILLGGGAEVKAYAAAGQSLLLVLVLKGHGALASRVGRMRLLNIVLSFFAWNLVVFAVALRARGAIGVPFYLWVGVFSVTVLASFWSFANDVYRPEQGRRLFVIIGAGSSLGAVVGATLGRSLSRVAGPGELLLGAAELLIVSLAWLSWV